MVAGQLLRPRRRRQPGDSNSHGQSAGVFETVVVEPGIPLACMGQRVDRRGSRPYLIEVMDDSGADGTDIAVYTWDCPNPDRVP